MELRALTGKTTFDGAIIENTEHFSVVWFMIDGSAYVLVGVTDSDGQGSFQGVLRTDCDHIQDDFESFDVMCIHDDSEYSDMLSLYSTDNGQPVMRIGYTQADDRPAIWESKIFPENFPTQGEGDAPPEEKS